MTQHYRLGGTDGERLSVPRAEALRDVRCPGHESQGMFWCARCFVWVCWSCEGMDHDGVCDRCWQALIKAGKTELEIDEQYPTPPGELEWPPLKPPENDKSPI